LKKLKILWLSHLVPYPPRGFGVLQRAHNLVREVARYHDLYLLAFVQNKLLASTFPTVREGLDESQRVLSGFCRHVEFVPIPSEQHQLGVPWLALSSLLRRDPSTVNWLKSGTMATAVDRLAGQVPLDLVHFDTISLAPYLPRVEQLATVMDHHSIESHMLLRRAEKESSLLKRLYYWQEGFRLRRYETRICARMDANITCSDLDSDRLRELVGNHSRVTEIPNGVDIDYFKPMSRDVVPHSMVFVGSLNWYPNRDAMLYFADVLWPLIRQRYPAARMDVVGAEPPTALLELAERDPQFHVHGFVDDVRPYISAAAVYVCPIRDGGGTRLKILDALAMGKAVLAHPIAYEGLNVTDKLNILTATEPAEYLAHLDRLFNDEVHRQTIGRAGRELIEREYSYASIGRRLANLYGEIVDARSRPAPGNRE
jgi:glycosyltransferase involved in cell wall biosynthesis